MAPTLATLAHGRNNHCNLLRFVAATLVLFGHCYPIANDSIDPLMKAALLDIPRIAVDVFFVLSGFLVSGSLFVRQQLTSFCLSRLLRIFPALVVSVLLTVLVIGTCFTSLPAADYLTHPQTRDFLLNNLVLFHTQYSLPGVFANNPLPDTVNGSLWTLGYEIRLYLLLALLGFFSYSRWRWLPEKRLQQILLALAFVVTAALIAAIKAPRNLIDKDTMDTLRLSSMFLLGSSLYIARHHVRLRGSVVLAMITVALLFKLKVLHIPNLWSHKAFLICYSLFIPYIVLYIAYLPGKLLREFNRVGDYSYGIYLYAFPLQQALAVLFAPLTPWQLFALSLPPTLLLAVVSWHWLEKPLLTLKR